MEQIAFSELNMTPETLYNITPRNYLNAQIGAANLYRQKEQSEWERARWMSTVVVNPHIKKNLKPKDITVFHWEKTSKAKKKKKYDKEKMIKQSEYMEKLDAKSLNKNKKKNA